jgi:hypothetical protein
MNIKDVLDKTKYRIPVSGHPLLHEELAWFATDDDVALGVLIRDKVDNDYSWVVLIDLGKGYTCISNGVSHETALEAKEKLFREMIAISTQLTTGKVPDQKMFVGDEDVTSAAEEMVKRGRRR